MTDKILLKPRLYHLYLHGRPKKQSYLYLEDTQKPSCYIKCNYKMVQRNEVIFCLDDSQKSLHSNSYGTFF